MYWLNKKWEKHLTFFIAPSVDDVTYSDGIRLEWP